MNVVLTLLINGLMAGLLLATMIYCRKLNSRIKILQDSKSELARIIREFDESTQRATQSILDIHAATDRISDNIQHKIDKANFLADDLQYMIDKGQKLSGKPDPAPAVPPVTARAPRVEPTVMPRSEAAPAAAFVTDMGRGASDPSAPRGQRARSRAEQEIMNALGGKKE